MVSKEYSGHVVEFNRMEGIDLCVCLSLHAMMGKARNMSGWGREIHFEKLCFMIRESVEDSITKIAIPATHKKMPFLSR